MQTTAEAIGEGKVGRTFRFALEWDGPRGPDTVVGKFASDDEQSRMAGLLTGTYVREINFFHDLADQVDIRMPTCHHAELDVTTGDFAILMAARPRTARSHYGLFRAEILASFVNGLGLVALSGWIVLESG